MNFTKDYIELAKDKRIQGLREFLVKEDKVCVDWEGQFKFDYTGIINYPNRIADLYALYSFGEKYKRKQLLWLPTGDQLDEEIIKICKKNKFNSPWYEIRHTMTGCDVVIEYYFDNKPIRICKIDINPLIAKIKLLLQLLEVSK